MATKQRLSNLDLMKAMAVLFVMSYHPTRSADFDILTLGTPAQYINYFFMSILSTCVPIFLFVNGYLLFQRELDLKKHIMKMARLAGLLFAWSFILLFIYMVMENVPIDFSIMVTLIADMDYDWSMNYMWFIGALECVYLLYPALKALFDSNIKGFWFFTAACLILSAGFAAGNQILLWICTYLGKEVKDLNQPILTMFNPFSGLHGASCLVYFCVGGLVYKYQDRILGISRVKRNVIASAGLLVSCSCLFAVAVINTKYVYGEIYDSIWFGYESIFTLCNVLCLYVLCLNYTGKSAFIRSVGSNALGIYFIHALLLRATLSALRVQIPIFILPIKLGYAFALMSGSLLVCLILRKIPVLRRLVMI